MPTDYSQRSAENRAIIGIIGLGYVDSPPAEAFFDWGRQTVDFGVEKRNIDQMLPGRSYTRNLKSKWIYGGIRNESLRVTTDMSQLGKPAVMPFRLPRPLNAARLRMQVNWAELSAPSLKVTALRE